MCLTVYKLATTIAFSHLNHAVVTLHITEHYVLRIITHFIMDRNACWETQIPVRQITYVSKHVCKSVFIEPKS